MKQVFKIFIFCVLSFTSCQIEQPIEYRQKSAFTIADAKNYFEQNAKDLQNVYFTSKSKTRHSLQNNLVPNWKEAKITQSGEITTVEIPLNGDVRRIAQTFKVNTSKKVYGVISEVTTKLIIQSHKDSGTTRQFVVTMIDDVLEHRKKEKTRNYYGKNNYSGYIIASALTGEYLESFRSINGLWKRVYISPGTKSDLEEPYTESINLYMLQGIDDTYETGEVMPTCPTCTNPMSMCTCCKLCNGEGCEVCMVTVYPTCPKCGFTGPNAHAGQCNCCPFCHETPCICSALTLCNYCLNEPCTCDTYRCQYCGSRYCSGNCIGGGDIEEDEEETCPHESCHICGKAIRLPNETMSRTTTACMHNEYCETDGKCIRVEISIKNNLQTVNLGETYIIEVKLTPTNATYDNLEYYIKNSQINKRLTNNEELSVEVMARSPGTFQIYAEVRASSVVFSSPDISITHQFPTWEEIIQQDGIREEMEKSWQETLQNSDESGMQEFGGVVVLNTQESHTGKLYEYVRAAGEKVPYSSPAATISMELSFRDSGPTEGGRFTVLHYHTHPPYWGYTGNQVFKRRLGPSEPDIAQIGNMPGLVKDFTHPTDTIHTQMNRSEYESNTKLYPYGTERREI